MEHRANQKLRKKRKAFALEKGEIVQYIAI